jgi:hypothetical protein
MLNLFVEVITVTVTGGWLHRGLVYRGLAPERTSSTEVLALQRF